MSRFSPIAGMGYAVVQTSAMDAWKTYATQVLGFMPSKLELPKGHCAFRMDDRMARLILQPGENQVAAIGWDIAGAPEWDDLLSRLDRAGIKTKELPSKTAHQRAARHVIQMVDPAGDTVEFAFQPEHDCIDRFVSPLGVNFVTGDQGMGHITRAVKNYDQCVEFYRDVLGMRVRETIDLKIRATFLSPNPRQHSVALIDGGNETHWHHIMSEVDSIDHVGRALDKVLNGAAKLTVTLGRHFNDKMTSFYMATPSGLQWEYGFGGLRVDLDHWVENTQGGVGGASVWGHHPVKDADHKDVEDGFRRAR